jgi:hypothetical protein
MSDDLIDRLSADLKPVAPRALERRIVFALGIGLIATIAIGFVVLDLVIDRPFGGAYGGPMFWVKLGYTLAFGLLGLAALPVLVRPNGRIVWPIAVAAAVAVIVLTLGTMGWMNAGFPMPMLMGGTALVCPWLIILTAIPLLVVLLTAARSFAPRSPTVAGFAAGLVAGGFGAAAYSFYCGETSTMFMGVWYALGVGLTALLGAVLGRFVLRW